MLKYAYEQQQLDFLHLCSLGDEQRVRDALLSGRVDFEYKHRSNGWTALHWAAYRGHEAVCLLLIDAGFSLDVEDCKGQIPYDVCPKDKKSVLELLQLGEADLDSLDSNMVENTSSRISSDASQSSSPTNGFVPNYIRNPPFPYSMKNSFDNYATPPSPGSPGPINSPTYSYGRRDSFNKTRFLLVRTSIEKGKETYKRVTLPGGSDVERLKLTIEKACKGRIVDMVFTLPENDLVENDEQIHKFKDCQKIDVIFKEDEKEKTPEVTGDVTRMSEERSSLPKERVVEKSYFEDEKPADIEIPSSESQQDEVKPEEEDLRPLTPPEDLSSFVKEPSPPISLNATDVESNNGSTTDEPKLVPLATRSSMDSDPGDFEKVDKEEAKLGDMPAVAGIAAAIPIISAQVEEEAKHAPKMPEPEFTQPSSKATVVEESKHVPEDRREAGEIVQWIHNNAELVGAITIVVGVAGVAGIGYLIYAKKFK